MISMTLSRQIHSVAKPADTVFTEGMNPIVVYDSQEVGPFMRASLERIRSPRIYTELVLKDDSIRPKFFSMIPFFIESVSTTIGLNYSYGLIIWQSANPLYWLSIEIHIEVICIENGVVSRFIILEVVHPKTRWCQRNIRANQAARSNY